VLPDVPATEGPQAEISRGRHRPFLSAGAGRPTKHGDGAPSACSAARRRPAESS